MTVSTVAARAGAARDGQRLGRGDRGDRGAGGWRRWAFGGALNLGVFGATIAIGYFVYHNVTAVQKALPARVIEQQQDISRMLQTLSDVVRLTEVDSLNAGMTSSMRVLSGVEVGLQHLDTIRKTHNFDLLVGASAMHAVANPALRDSRRWLLGGIDAYQPDSSTVLHLVHLRLADAVHLVGGILDRSNKVAGTLITNESARLQRFRDLALASLVGFGLLAMGIVSLYARKRTAEAHIGRERERLVASIESLDEGFALFGKDGRLLECNQRYRTMYPAVAKWMQPGVTLTELIRHFMDEGCAQAIGDSTEGLLELRNTLRDNPGKPFVFHMSDGRYIRVYERHTPEGERVQIHTDITGAKLAQDRLQHLATHDALTGLPSRSYFQERLANAIAQGRRHRYQVAVMYFDLDRFKLINDTLGHASGDSLLEIAAKRLKDCVRENDTVARLGGDEFAAILDNVHNLQEVGATAQRIVASLSRPYELGDAEGSVTTSIGISVFPRDGENVSELLSNADSACYHAKSAGRNNFQFYNDEISSQDTERVSLEKHLKLALQRRELAVHYQPQMDAASGTVVGMEALLRWRNPELGAVPPARFIPVAEETGLIADLGEWVLRQACAQNEQWRQRGLREICVSVNISPRQFRHQNLPELVKQVLAETGLDADGLALEITESAIMQDVEHALAAMKELNDLGVRLAIDDFGTGYSSLSSLKRFPIDMLKIDYAFVRDITTDPDDLEIVSAVIAMAHNLKLKVVAEGVETQEQLRLLNARDSDEIQGYLISEPLPAREVEKFLEPTAAGFSFIGGA